MKVGYTIIYVSDVVKTIDFYQTAFGLNLKFLHESHQYAEMDTGETTLAFCSETLAQTNGLNFSPNRIVQKPSGFEIALLTDNVQEAFDIALKAGAHKILEPTQKPWEQVVAYVRDNNGILVEICSAVASQ